MPADVSTVLGTADVRAAIVRTATSNQVYHEARQLLVTARRRLVSDLFGEPAAGFGVTELKTLDGDPLATTLNHETHRERLQRFAALKPRERRDLFLRAAGYAFTEIADLSGGESCHRRVPGGRVR